MRIRKILFIFFILIIFFNTVYCNCSYTKDFEADSPAAIVLNSNTGKILYEKNAYKKMYPASTTKIMTAILTLENCDLSDNVIVSQNATTLPIEYVSAHLQVGEELTVEELLNLLLIMSANDAAIVLAEHISGSVENFSVLMNNKAKEIGCLNTNFVNPNGVHNVNHYSTAYDLAIIGQYAMKNQTFRDIVSTVSYKMGATNKYHERTIYNTNKLLHKYNDKNNTEENIYYYEYAIGVKTGYTSDAKNCLVACAMKDNAEYITVILGAKQAEDNYNSQRYSDIKNLFETAFNNYSLSTIKENGSVITNVEISNGYVFEKNLDLILENDINILMKNEDLNSEIKQEIKLYNEKLQAPISKGAILGTVTYTYDDIMYTENIIAANDVNTNDKLFLYTKLAIGGLLVIVLIRVCNKSSRRKRRKRR